MTENEQAVLKPCPLCRKALTILGGVNSYGRCDTDGCWMNERKMTVPIDDARQVLQWNTRALQASQPGAVDVIRLRGALNTIKMAAGFIRCYDPEKVVDEGLAGIIGIATKALDTSSRVEAAQPQEAVAWMYSYPGATPNVKIERVAYGMAWTETPLYTTPPIQAAQPQEAVAKRYVNYEGHPELGSPNRSHPLQAKRTTSDDPPIQAADSAEQEKQALAGYRAAVSWIGSDSWDGCSDCVEILKLAVAADYARDPMSPDELAAELKRLRSHGRDDLLTGSHPRQNPDAIQAAESGLVEDVVNELDVRASDPGVVTDPARGGCVLSGKGFYQSELLAWNTRLQPSYADGYAKAIEDAAKVAACQYGIEDDRQEWDSPPEAAGYHSACVDIEAAIRALAGKDASQ